MKFHIFKTEIGLLVGYNFSRGMVPRKVIVGKDKETYGILTDLGWSIVGYSPPRLDVTRPNGLRHCLVLKELPSITPANVIWILKTDFKDTSEDFKKLSQDDILFLNKMKKSIKKRQSLGNASAI